MKLGIVIATGAGRVQNLEAVLSSLRRQEDPLEGPVAVVRDGHTEDFAVPDGLWVVTWSVRKYEPSQAGNEQPRNSGVRLALHVDSQVTHIAFLDSDVVVEPTWHGDIKACYEMYPFTSRVMVCPYDWMPPGLRPVDGDFTAARAVKNDPRWPIFSRGDPSNVSYGDIAAGLACFGGNIVWPVDEFQRTGGFWNEIHHGRAEDGELGLRAVSMNVGISFAAGCRGYHLDHEVNMEWKLEANARDVPMVNARHPWVEGEGVFMVDRDGKAFDYYCPVCGEPIPTLEMWDHPGRCSG